MFSMWPDPYGEILKTFVAGGNRVNDYDVASTRPSKYAIPSALLNQIRGETTMGWTGWVFEMKDGALFQYGSGYQFCNINSPEFQFILNAPPGRAWPRSPAPAGKSPAAKCPRALPCSCSGRSPAAQNKSSDASWFHRFAPGIHRSPLTEASPSPQRNCLWNKQVPAGLVRKIAHELRRRFRFRAVLYMDWCLAKVYA